MAKVERPFFPIVFVRGYAMNQAAIDATSATPYMGFNEGSTKARQAWTGEVRRHVFESPLVRLMKDHGYTDGYADGSERGAGLPARSVVIHRYYEAADSDLGGGSTPSIEEAATGLGELVLKLREQICGDDAEARAAFRVYLVAHSMGGLVCRCFLQNPAIASAEARRLVDKVFTYATPHDGIELAGLNVPGFVGAFDANNFNRARMRAYLALPDDAERVNDLGGHFDPARFFCLVGTNHADYPTAAGVSRRLAGEMSDGLVRIRNATVAGAPRAFAYRTHGGAHGIVNSEDGYQNLVRFLFGDLRVTGTLEVDALPLPPSVERARAAGRAIRASYHFEATVRPRGAVNYALTERLQRTHSAVFRSYDELMPGAGGAARDPYLFSVFLDTRSITRGRTVVFAAELAVSSTDYEIDGFLFFDQHIEGEVLYRGNIVLRATRTDAGWRLRYVPADERWGESQGSEVPEDERGPYVPLRSRKGFAAKLRLAFGAWNEG